MQAKNVEKKTKRLKLKLKIYINMSENILILGFRYYIIIYFLIIFFIFYKTVKMLSLKKRFDV